MLNKSICEKCWRGRYSHDEYCNEPLLAREFEKEWEQGYLILCCLSANISRTNEDPHEDCVYVLEQTVETPDKKLAV